MTEIKEIKTKFDFPSLLNRLRLVFVCSKMRFLRMFNVKY